MLIQEFNTLSLIEKGNLVFAKGKLIGIAKEYTLLKEFTYELYNFRVTVVYHKYHKKLVDVTALEYTPEKREYRKGA